MDHVFHSTSRQLLFDPCGPSLRAIRKNSSIRSEFPTNFIFPDIFSGSNFSGTSAKIMFSFVFHSIIPNIRQWTRKCFGFRSRYFFCKAFAKQTSRFVLQGFGKEITTYQELKKILTTYQERRATNLRKMLQRIKNLLQVWKM